MTSQVNSLSTEQRAPRTILFVLFLIGGLAIFLFGNNWNSVFPTNDSTLYKASLPIVFLSFRGSRNVVTHLIDAEEVTAR